MTTPLVSVIMPAHNVADYVGQSVASVLAQTMPDLELLIVDDGSTDATKAVLEALDDPRVRVLCQEHAGVSQTRNVGIAAARGTLIAFLDADDLWYSQTLERLTTPLRQYPDCVLVCGAFTRFEDGTQRHLPLPWTGCRHTGNAWYDMIIDNCLHLGAICVRAEVARRLPFDTSLNIGEDRDWFLRLFRGLPKASLRSVPEIVLCYRQRRHSAVRHYDRFLQDEARVLARHLDDPHLPPRIRRRSLSAADFHAAVLLAKLPGRRLAALGRFLRALWRDPLYMENYLRPLRKLGQKLIPSRILELPPAAIASATVPVPEPLCSLIVATCGRREDLRALLDSLRAQTYRYFEILLVDQNPPGFLSDILEQTQDLPLRHVPLDVKGASVARNTGLALATGDIIAFPDDDCLYAPDTLSAVVSTFQRFPSWGGLLGCWEDTGHAPGKPYAVVPPRPLNRYTAFRRGETYVMFFRSNAVAAVNGFDERLGPGAPPFFGSAEDTEYLIRLIDAGVAVGRSPAIRLFHPSVDPARPRPDSKTAAYALTRMYLLKKHRFPWWFQWANVGYPLACLPLDLCTQGWRAAHYRWISFRERFRGALWRWPDDFRTLPRLKSGGAYR